MFNLEIAEQKVEETHGASRAHGYPLTVTLEPAD
jgi:ATP-dependent Clp protease adapter protein ClpS